MKIKLLFVLLALVATSTLSSCACGYGYYYEGPPTVRVLPPPGLGNLGYGGCGGGSVPPYLLPGNFGGGCYSGGYGQNQRRNNGINSIVPMQPIYTPSGPIFQGQSRSGNTFFQGAPRNVGDPMNWDPNAPVVYMYH